MNIKVISIAITLTVLIPVVIQAQDLESSSYKLVTPSISAPISDVVESTNFKQLFDSTVGSYTTLSSNYDLSGGTQTFIEANVPQASCFETDTNSGTTLCSNIPGADGMKAVCSGLGCFDRAKIEIDAQGNADDTRYAIQISTTSDFSTDVYYVNPATRLLDAGPLDDPHFIPKCEWEGTIVSGICLAANTTYQKHNILGLDPDTTYYLRLSAHKGTTTDGYFTQSDWGPSVNATTAIPALSLDIDIAPDTSTPTSSPYNLSLNAITVNQVTTSDDMIIIRSSTNLWNGIQTHIKGLNGSLDHSTLSDQIPTVSNDLDLEDLGYGIRNDSGNTSAQNTATLGDISVSSSPVDFTDTGAANKVGAVGTSLTKLLDSANAPLDEGIASFVLKLKPDMSINSGDYQETFTFIMFGNL